MTSIATGTTDLTPKDVWKENVLWNYKTLVCETDLYEAVDDCFSLGIFGEEEKDEIQCIKVKNEKNRQFLKILLRKSKSLFEAFLKSVSDDNIKNLLQNKAEQLSRLETEKDPKTKWKIYRHYGKIVSETSLRYMTDDFITNRLFEIEDWERITQNAECTSDENRRFLNTLLLKNSGFELFIHLLRDTGHTELASEIEEENVTEKIEKEFEDFLKQAVPDDRDIKSEEGSREERMHSKLRVSNLKKRLQAHYEDFIKMEVPDLEKIVKIYLQKNIITKEEAKEFRSAKPKFPLPKFLRRKSRHAPDDMSKKSTNRKFLEMLSQFDKDDDLRFFFNHAGKYETTIMEEESINRHSNDEQLRINIMMSKERILEDDIDVDAFLDVLISNFVIDINERNRFDHRDSRNRKENILNHLLEKESIWESVLLQFLKRNGFTDTANEIINMDSGYHEWEKKLQKKLSLLIKKDLRKLIQTCEQYNIISSKKCSDLLQKSIEDCNREFFGWIFKTKKVNDLRLVFYDKESDILKEIDGVNADFDIKYSDKSCQLDKQILLNEEKIIETDFDCGSFMDYLIDKKVLLVEDMVGFSEKIGIDQRRTVFDLLSKSGRGWGKHLIDFFTVSQHDNPILEGLLESILSTDPDLEDGKLPDEILNLGPNAEQAFLLAMQKGVEKRHHIRIMVVGAHGAGKSTLVNSLFKRGYDATKIKQTDGIDIHKNDCAICITSGEWKHDQEFVKLLTDPKNRKGKAISSQVDTKPETVDEKAIEIEGASELENKVSSEPTDTTKRNTISKDTAEETNPYCDYGEAVGEFEDNLKIYPSETKAKEENALTSTEKAEINDVNNSEEKEGERRKDFKTIENRESDYLDGTMESPFNDARYRKTSEKDTYVQENEVNAETANENVPLVNRSSTSASIKLKSCEEEIKELSCIRQLPRDHCLVTVWDFGGHYIFYSTHQTFLTRRAIYLIVLNISRPLSERVKELDTESEKRYGFKLFSEEDFYRFWIQSILCYGGTAEQICPTIFVILTHIDKIRPEELSQRKREYALKIKSIARENGLNIPNESIIAVNSMDPTDSQFDDIRERIFEEAKKQTYWGESTPASYIMMEDYLLLQNTEKIDEVGNICQLASRVLSSGDELIQENEMVLTFLKYQHELGNLIYFDEEELNKYVILNPKFLIDAFKCIFTFLKKGKLEEFEKFGKIDKSQIENIWNKEHLSEYTKYFLHLFIRLGIIVRCSLKDGAITYFFAPCKLKKKFDPEKIERMMEHSMKSPILCFTSTKKFISPATTSRILTSCISEWGDVVQEEEEKGELMIYCDGGIFKLDDMWLLVAILDGLLLIRVISGNQSTLRQCHEIRSFFQQKVNEINKSCSPDYHLKEYVKCSEPFSFSKDQNHCVKIEDKDFVEVTALINENAPRNCSIKHALNTDELGQIWGIEIPANRSK